MANLEPSYLRYIHDGLNNGNIHPENAAELPDGLIGMYEDAFDERMSVLERQKLLKYFAIWALLKKEVSAAFVAEVLDNSEDDIQQFISTYSAWFNSPVSGKYQLYHERLKVYLLQKLSEREILALNNNLISKLEICLEEQKEDEFEYYGLEFLAGHLSVRAMLSGDGKQLKKLAYSQATWQRQLKISKGYTWTKNGLKEVMFWASKHNEDEVIECGLQMVDLHHQEQNSAPQIVALVAEGDFDSALKRIEQFGENNKEGIEHRFILYMICLMELTLLGSKNKPFKKYGIKKLLNHFDEQIPKGKSNIDWHTFFSSHIIFLMACEWEKLEISFSMVYCRTTNWEKDWIPEQGPYSSTQFKVLVDSVFAINENYDKKSFLLKYISIEMNKQGMLQEASELITKASEYAHVYGEDAEEFERSHTLRQLADTYTRNGNFNKALKCAKDIIYKFDKDVTIKNISIEMARLGKFDKASVYIESISGNYDKSSAKKYLAVEIAKKGTIEKAIQYANLIEDEWEKSQALMLISTELINLGETLKAKSLIDRTILSIRNIDNYWERGIALYFVFAELYKQGEFDNANSIFNESIKFAFNFCTKGECVEIIRDISSELAKQSQLEKATEIIQMHLNFELQMDNFLDPWLIFELSDQGRNSEAMSFLNNIKSMEQKRIDEMSLLSVPLFDGEDDDYNTYALYLKAKTHALNGNLEDAIECLFGIDIPNVFVRALNSIFTEFTKQTNLENVTIRIIEVFNYYINAAEGQYSLEDDDYNTDYKSYLSDELARQGKFAEAIEYAHKIKLKRLRQKSINNISIEQAKLTKFNEALKRTQGSVDDNLKWECLKNISIIMAEHGRTNESLKSARKITNANTRVETLKEISIRFGILGNLELQDITLKEAMEDAYSISNYRELGESIISISHEFYKLGAHKISLSLMNEARELESLIENQIEQDKYFEQIVIESCIQDLYGENFIKAIYIYDTIIDLEKQNLFLNKLSIELAKHSNLNMAEKVGLEIQEVLTRQSCFNKMAHSILKQSNWKSALEVGLKLQNKDARFSYLHGWADSLSANETDNGCLKKVFPLIVNHNECLEILLRKYSKNEIVFVSQNEILLQRINETLKIQWAIDISKHIN